MWGKHEETLRTKNGDMRFVRAFGRESLYAHDHTEQSGPYMNALWRRAFRALPRTLHPQSILFLGVGLGGALQYAAKRFPNAHMTGIDWDAHLCALARERLVPQERFTITCADAQESLHAPQRADVLCIDLFSGKALASCMHDATFQDAIAHHTGTILVNVYTHHETLDALDTLMPDRKQKRVTYYRSIIGIYGPLSLRS